VNVFAARKACGKAVDKSIASSLLTTAFPHSFTPYPHSAGKRKVLTGGFLNNYKFYKSFLRAVWFLVDSWPTVTPLSWRLELHLIPRVISGPSLSNSLKQVRIQWVNYFEHYRVSFGER
jgi:hypothetical protein